MQVKVLWPYGGVHNQRHLRFDRLLPLGLDVDVDVSPVG